MHRIYTWRMTKHNEKNQQRSKKSGEILPVHELKDSVMLAFQIYPM